MMLPRINLTHSAAIHIGAMDKKMASIALATRSPLLFANTSDFKQVPGLTIDNWMN